MGMNLFTALTPSFFNFRRQTGDNKLATLNQVNQVINTMNQLVNYRPYDIQFTGSTSGVPLLAKSVMLAGECNRNCSAICSACHCAPACNDENTAAFDAIMEKTGVGTYTLTLTYAPGAGYDNIKGVGIFPSALPEPTHAIGISEVLPPTPGHRIFTVKTTDAGVLADSIIDNVILQLRIYGANYQVFLPQ